MSTLEAHNLMLMRRWYQEVWNERREEALDELLDRNVLAHGLGDEVEGFEEFKAAWRGALQTFDEFQVDVKVMIASGDLVATRFVASGIHVGPGLGVAPTGRRVAFAVQNFSRWREGRIVEGWNVLDMASAYRQIGCTIHQTRGHERILPIVRSDEPPFCPSQASVARRSRCASTSSRSRSDLDRRWLATASVRLA